MSGSCNFRDNDHLGTQPLAHPRPGIGQIAPPCFCRDPLMVMRDVLGLRTVLTFGITLGRMRTRTTANISFRKMPSLPQVSC